MIEDPNTKSIMHLASSADIRVPEPKSTIEVFISYALRDAELKEELEKHLSALKRQGLIMVWHEGKMIGGEERERTIVEHITKAQIILLLVSRAYLDSRREEMRQAMQRHKAGDARVIPVIIRSTAWRHTPFGELQVLPKNAEAVTEWTNHNAGFLDIVRDLRGVIDELYSISASSLPTRDTTEIQIPEAISAIEVFISYVDEDEELLYALIKHLSPSQKQGLIFYWHRRMVSPGLVRQREIDAHLNRSHIILILVSSAYLQSAPYKVEMKRAIERHEHGEARVIPVILYPTEWERTPLGKLPALPTGAVPVASKSWNSLDDDEALWNASEIGRDRALEDVAVNVRKVAEELLATFPAGILSERLRSVRTTQLVEKVTTHYWYLYLSVSLETIPRIGKAIAFMLHLTPDKDTGGTPLHIPTNALEIAIYIEAPGFYIDGEHLHSLPVVEGRPLQNSFSLPVNLVPLVSGDQTLRLLVYPGGRVEGLEPAVVSSIIQVATLEVLPDIPELIDRRTIPNPQPEVTLYVSLDGEGERSQTLLHITCPTLGLYQEPLEPLPLTDRDLATLRQSMIQTARGSASAAPSDVLSSFRATGAMLFDRLIPRGHRLRQIYGRIAQLAAASPTPWSWLIISDEQAIVPWELVYPYDRPYDLTHTQHHDFLADAFVLAHWVGRRGLILRNDVPVGWLALAHYNQYLHEQPRWHRILENYLPEGLNESPWFQLFMRSDLPYYGLHVLQYVDSSQSGRVTYGGEQEDTDTSHLNAEAMVHQRHLDLTLRRPLFGLSFVNGLSAGFGAELDLRDIHLEAQWLLPFMRAGASALVGSRWSVSQEADQLFFHTFYRLIRKGTPLGWAVWIARTQVRQAFSHRPDWLAYTYFGHPLCEPYQVRPAQGITLFEAIDHLEDAPFEAGRSYQFRASYRTEAPPWYSGRLHIQQTKIRGGELSVMVAPLINTRPETYSLRQVPTSNDYFCIVSLTMPQSETTLPVLVRFQEGEQELRTLLLNLEVAEKRSVEG